LAGQLRRGLQAQFFLHGEATSMRDYNRFCATAISVLATLAWASPAQAQSVNFAPPINPMVGASPRSVATGDFDGSGTNDFAAANSGSGNISVVLNNGNGTYQNAVNYASGTNTYALVAADLNRDGRLDLAAASFGQNALMVLLGNGDGTFQAANSFSVGSGPDGIVAVDLNEDGILDLVSCNYGSNNISMLIGIGNGSFQAAVNYGVGVEPRSIVAGDFNKDGNSDIAVANGRSNNVSLLLGIGNGVLQPAASFSTGQLPFSLTAGDFNSDSNLDLAVVNLNGNSLSILLGNGSGSFSGTANYATGTAPAGVAAADLDGDQRIDVVVANSGSNNVSVLLQSSMGTLLAAQNFGAGSSPLGVASSDQSGDGKPDLIVANFTGANVSVLRNTTAFPARSFSISGYPSPTSAGVQSTFVVTARDAFGNVATGYTGTAAFTSSDSQAVVPPNTAFVALDNGVRSFQATLKLAGIQSISATDTQSATLTGTQNAIQVNPGSAATLTVTGFPTPVAAGNQRAFVVTARDSFTNLATGYTGTVALTTSDNRAFITTPATFTASNGGTQTLQATFNTTGTHFIRATDSQTASITGTQPGIMVINTVPVLSSQPAAAPNPASIGAAIRFSAAASDADNHALTFSWNFGDGVTAFGSSISHSYTAAGVYPVSLTVSDSFGGTIGSNLAVAVSAQGTSGGGDSDYDGIIDFIDSDDDNDGFFDELEIALGSLPADPNSTPFGGRGASATRKVSLVQRARIRLNFAEQGRDRISLSGSIPVPTAFVSAGQVFSVYVGGIGVSARLDSRGFRDRQTKIRIRGNSRSLQPQNLNFSLDATGDFTEKLTDEGLTNSGSGTKQVLIVLLFNETIYSELRSMTYSSDGNTCSAR
jgi:hypothetical protein